IDECMMQPKQWVGRGVHDVGHGPRCAVVANPAHPIMDDVVYLLQGCGEVKVVRVPACAIEITLSGEIRGLRVCSREAREGDRVSVEIRRSLRQEILQPGWDLPVVCPVPVRDI